MRTASFAENDPKTAEIVSKTLPFAGDREMKSPPSRAAARLGTELMTHSKNAIATIAVLL